MEKADNKFGAMLGDVGAVNAMLEDDILQEIEQGPPEEEDDETHMATPGGTIGGTPGE